jgi:hypothetical protein
MKNKIKEFFKTVGSNILSFFGWIWEKISCDTFMHDLQSMPILYLCAIAVLVCMFSILILFLTCFIIFILTCIWLCYSPIPILIFIGCYMILHFSFWFLKKKYNINKKK